MSATVTVTCVESLRVVACAGMRDPIDTGEEVGAHPPGGSNAARRQMIAYALANRGVDVSVDVFCHKLVWERFLSVCYDAGDEVDPETGIILNRQSREERPRDLAAETEHERERFEADRKRRESRRRAAETRGAPKPAKSATNH